MRRTWLAGATLLVALGLVRCGKPTCDAESCAGGCCDEVGVCHAGRETSSCGKGGVMCADCGATGLVCVAAQVCTTAVGGDAGTGSDAGNTSDAGGGDAGVSDGGNDGGNLDAGCRALAAFVPAFESAQYVNDGYDELVMGSQFDPAPQPPPDGGFDRLDLEVWPLSGPPALPLNRSFTNATDYSTCDVCLIFGEGCVGDQCEHLYLAQGGSATVTQVDLATVGRITASGTSLKFIEWNFASDIPVPSGRCIEVGSMSMDINWDQSDGGDAG